MKGPIVPRRDGSVNKVGLERPFLLSSPPITGNMGKYRLYREYMGLHVPYSLKRANKPTRLRLLP